MSVALIAVVGFPHATALSPVMVSSAAVEYSHALVSSPAVEYVDVVA